MSDSFIHVDLKGLPAFTSKWRDRADPLLVGELTTGFVKAGNLVKRSANGLIKGGESSNLARASTVNMSVSSKQITATVSWANARSKTGFPYAAAYNGGRRAFGPVQAKALHFVVNGHDVFAMHVKAFAGTRFIQRGLAASKSAAIGEIHAAIGRWKAKMA